MPLQQIRVIDENGENDQSPRAPSGRPTEIPAPRQGTAGDAKPCGPCRLRRRHGPPRARAWPRPAARAGAARPKSRERRLHIGPIVTTQRLIANQPRQLAQAALKTGAALGRIEGAALGFRAGRAFRPADGRSRGPPRWPPGRWSGRDRPGPAPPGGGRIARCGRGQSIGSAISIARSRGLCVRRLSPSKHRIGSAAIAPEQFALTLGQGVPSGATVSLIARPGHCDDVDIAFDNDDLALVVRGLARAVVIEQHRALVEQLGLRRVQVFWLGVGADRPAAESDHSAAASWIGNITPVAKPVVGDVDVLAVNQQTGGDHLRRRRRPWQRGCRAARSARAAHSRARIPAARRRRSRPSSR